MSSISRMALQIASLEAELLNCTRNLDRIMASFDDTIPLHSGSAGSLSASLRDEIMSHVSGFFEREAKCVEVFELLKGTTKSGKVGILRETFQQAMENVKVYMENDSATEIFDSLDANKDEVLDLSEFKEAVNRPSKIEQWVSLFPCNSLVASALTPIVSTKLSSQKTSLKLISECSDEELQVACEGVCKGLMTMLQKEVKALRDAFASNESNSSSTVGEAGGSKFTIGVMNCGNIEHFFQGLTTRVGFPNLKFMEGMEEEHCARSDSEARFVTTNYGLETCPRDEWLLVIHADQSKNCSRTHRRMPNYLALLGQSDGARLRDCEIVAIILYTGPMFQIYNGVLRASLDGGNAFRGGNTYATTIHCLVSAVTKISRVTRVPAGLPLYRGIGGIDLPHNFYRTAATAVPAAAPKESEEDEEQVSAGGFRCFVELGFMSTTRDRATAIHYTGVARGRAIPTLLQVRTAAVDHGADIGRFSQYPGEEEFLWNPLSLVEPLGEAGIEVTPHGIVRIFPVRMNLNVKCLTVEELEKQKKTMHLSAFRYLLYETEFSLRTRKEEIMERISRDPGSVHNPREYAAAADSLVSNIAEQCQKVLTKHRSKPTREFLEGPAFRTLVIEMLDVVLFANSKVNHYLQDHSVKLHLLKQAPLRTAHRRFVSYLERYFDERWPNWCPPPPEPGVPDEAQRYAWTLCLAKGLVSRPLEQMRGSNALDELNDLGEPRIVAGAAEGLSTTELKLLVAARANVNAVDERGTTAIMRAATSGNDRVLRVLTLELEGDPHKVRAYDDNTALIMAAREGHALCVKVLIEELHVDVLASDQGGYTALMGAAENGHVNCLRLIAAAIQRHAAHAGGEVRGVDSQTGRGMSALRYAAKYGYAKCVEELVRFNAAVDPPALIIARFCHRGSPTGLACVRTLAERSWAPCKGDAVLVHINGAPLPGKVQRVDLSRCPLLVHFTGDGAACNGWFPRQAVQRDLAAAHAAHSGLALGLRVRLAPRYRQALADSRPQLGNYLSAGASVLDVGGGGVEGRALVGVLRGADPPEEAAVGGGELRLWLVEFEEGGGGDWFGVDAWYAPDDLVLVDPPPAPAPPPH